MYVFVNILYNASPPLIVCMTLLVYVSLGNEIDAAGAFTTILLFQILQIPITQLPMSIAELVQIWSSLKRIEKFLFASEINSSYIQKH